MKGFNILSETETLQAAVNGMSIARLGDGEIKVAAGGNAKSQQRHPRLAALIRELLIRPGLEVLPCVPTFRKDSPKRQFWNGQEPRFRALMSPDVQYGSSLITRPDSAPWIDTPEYWDLMRSLWAGKDVMLLRGSGKSLTPERLSLAKSVQEVLTPVRHAFSEYDNLKSIVRSEHGGHTVLLACGSTATALAYELGNEGIHMVDVGHAGMFVGRREGQFRQ